jgi:putative CocE/NonD family hydrolase
MMGADEWRYAPTLEAASSGKTLELYLEDASGTPRDLFHSGALQATVPDAQPPAVLVSDPRELPAVELARLAADEDAHSQFRALQKRAISFHSEPFAQDTEVAGHIRLTLDCSADAPDFDLWAQLLLIEPDGTTVRLGEDIRRARFRNDPFQQELLQPGQVVQIPFEFKWTAWRFPAGSRLRLTLAPLNSPDYQKNFNTGGRIGYERIEDARVANIQILHQAGHASHLTLPLAAAH